MAVDGIVAEPESDKPRFGFGKNWVRFSTLINEDRFSQAEESLRRMTQLDTFTGLRFLDIGSGSGLFSLAARRMGATVYSFDNDQDSVACTRALREQFFRDDPMWEVAKGSVLNIDYITSLGQFDIVYSWGVLHHTGAMWKALENAALPVNRNGTLCIAIYNDQRWVSSYWKAVKRAYNSNLFLRAAVVVAHLPYPFGCSVLLRALTGRLKPRRGMSVWYDYLDWLGGYPFEVAKPEEIFSFYRERGLNLTWLSTCGGRHGCNEFTFKRNGGANR